MSTNTSTHDFYLIEEREKKIEIVITRNAFNTVKKKKKKSDQISHI